MATCGHCRVGRSARAERHRRDLSSLLTTIRRWSCSRWIHWRIVTTGRPRRGRISLVQGSRSKGVSSSLLKEFRLGVFCCWDCGFWTANVERQCNRLANVLRYQDLSTSQATSNNKYRHDAFPICRPASPEKVKEQKRKCFRNRLARQSEAITAPRADPTKTCPAASHLGTNHVDGERR